MDVILLQQVDNLGNLGDKVTVKSGYGRNFLLPTGRAVSATPENVKAFEARRAELEKEASAALRAAETRKVQFDALPSVKIARKTGDEGRLFGSVGTADIAAAVQAAGVELAKNELRLPQGAFRVVGEYEVDVHLHADVNATVKLEIAAED